MKQYPASINNKYDRLGISRNASTEEIKKAFRRLAMQWHPDKCTEDKKIAEDNFKAISEAYEILSDPDKRRVYDNELQQSSSPQFHEDYFPYSAQQNTYRSASHSASTSKTSLFSAVKSGDIYIVQQVLDKGIDLEAIFRDQLPDTDALTWAFRNKYFNISLALINFIVRFDINKKFLTQLFNDLQSSISDISDEQLNELLTLICPHYDHANRFHADAQKLQNALTELLQKFIQQRMNKRTPLSFKLIDSIINRGANLFEWYIVMTLLQYASDEELRNFAQYYGPRRLIFSFIRCGSRTGIDKIISLGFSLARLDEDNANIFESVAIVKQLFPYHFARYNIHVPNHFWNNEYQIITMLKSAGITPSIYDLIKLIELKNLELVKEYILNNSEIPYNSYIQFFHMLLKNAPHNIFYKRIIDTLYYKHMSLPLSHDDSGNNFLHSLALRTDGNASSIFTCMKQILDTFHHELVSGCLNELANEKNNAGHLPEQLTTDTTFIHRLEDMKRFTHSSPGSMLLIATLQNNALEVKRILNKCKNSLDIYLDKKTTHTLNGQPHQLTALEIAIASGFNEVAVEIFQVILPSKYGSLERVEQTLIFAANNQFNKMFVILLNQCAARIKEIYHGDILDFTSLLTKLAILFIRKDPNNINYELINALQKHGANIFTWEITLTLLKSCNNKQFIEYATHFGSSRLIHAYMKYGIISGIYWCKNLGFKLFSEDDDRQSPFTVLANYQIIPDQLMNKEGFFKNRYVDASATHEIVEATPRELLALLIKENILPTYFYIYNAIFAQNGLMFGLYIDCIKQKIIIDLNEGQYINLFHTFLRQGINVQNPTIVLQNILSLAENIVLSVDNEGNNCLHTILSGDLTAKIKLLEAIETYIRNNSQHTHSANGILLRLVNSANRTGKTPEQLTENPLLLSKLKEWQKLDGTKNNSASHLNMTATNAFPAVAPTLAQAPAPVDVQLPVMNGIIITPDSSDDERLPPPILFNNDITFFKKPSSRSRSNANLKKHLLNSDEEISSKRESKKRDLAKIMFLMQLPSKENPDNYINNEQINFLKRPWK